VKMPPPKNTLNPFIPPAVLPTACQEHGCVFSLGNLENLPWTYVALRHDGADRTVFIAISEEEIDDVSTNIWGKLRPLIERLHGEGEEAPSESARPD
jgi:hypothetical protein